VSLGTSFSEAETLLLAGVVLFGAALLMRYIIRRFWVLHKTAKAEPQGPDGNQVE
jgi:hypothetical protein